MEARLSEPPAVRQAVAAETRRRLIDAGADPDATSVQILSAFKQGLSWLREVVTPQLRDKPTGEIVIEFLENRPPSEWPQQAMHTPLRWLHEIFPADELLASDLGLDLDQIRFEMADSGPVYRVRVFGPDGGKTFEDTFDPVWVLRPYFDRFRDYEQVRVTTGWIRAAAGGETLADERIVTDPEWFWDHFQGRTLPSVYDYVMDRHEGNPRGGRADAPYFGSLTVDLEISEPDYRLGIDNEIISPMDALHEEIYFGTIEFFHLLGRNARGQDLTYPGRIIPRMVPKDDGKAGRGTIRFTGFRHAPSDGRRDLPAHRRHCGRAASGDPQDHHGASPACGAWCFPPDRPPLHVWTLSVRVDSETDEREALLNLAAPGR